MDCPVQEFPFILIPFNEHIFTRSPLQVPKFLTWEGVCIHVRGEDARGVDFEELVQQQISLRKKVSEARAKGEKAFLPSLDLPRPTAGSGIPNRKQRQATAFKALKFYALVQRELHDVRNNNKINARLPWAIKKTRTNNVHQCQGNTEHAINGKSARYLSKASVEASQG